MNGNIFLCTRNMSSIVPEDLYGIYFASILLSKYWLLMVLGCKIDFKCPWQGVGMGWALLIQKKAWPTWGLRCKLSQFSLDEAQGKSCHVRSRGFIFPRISSPFVFCFFGVPLFSTNQATNIHTYIYIYIYIAGVLIPA